MNYRLKTWLTKLALRVVVRLNGDTTNDPRAERMFDLSKSHNVRPDWAATLTIYERKEGASR